MGYVSGELGVVLQPHYENTEIQFGGVKQTLKHLVNNFVYWCCISVLFFVSFYLGVAMWHEHSFSVLPQGQLFNVLKTENHCVPLHGDFVCLFDTLGSAHIVYIGHILKPSFLIENIVESGIKHHKPNLGLNGSE